jgi:hypothetical protein
MCTECGVCFGHLPPCEQGSNYRKVGRLRGDSGTFGAQDPITMRASTAKLGMNPAIIPIKKHQVASIVVCPVRSNTCP